MRIFQRLKRNKKRITPGPLSYQIENLQGIGKREDQEDAFAFVNALDVKKARQKGILAVVADGMGGMADGKWAGETVVASIKKSFLGMDDAGDICRQLEDSVWKASDEVIEKLEGAGGSTVVACVFYKEEMCFVSVGDSCLYLKREDQIFKLNREHNIKNQTNMEKIRLGNMTSQKADSNSRVEILTQFLGMRGLSELDSTCRPLPLMDGDVILLCTDGIGSVLDEGKILECLSKPVPSAICNALEEKVWMEKEPYQDNYTALVIMCGYEGGEEL